MMETHTHIYLERERERERERENNQIIIIEQLRNFCTTSTETLKLNPFHPDLFVSAYGK